MKRVQLKPREERRIKRGHSWIFRNELTSKPDIADGEVVDVFASNGSFVGRGFYQASGGIAVRLLARRQVEIDRHFLAEALQRALTLRCRLFPESSVFRWIFGESDGLPGLTLDRYGPVASAQTQCSFYSQYAEVLSEILLDYGGVKGFRLEAPGGVARAGEVDNPAAIDVDGVAMEVDFEGGQKTGLFLDQRMNVRAMDWLAPGARVFDGHCYAGLWSCRAAKAGAKEVVGVDTSEAALARARRNAELNGADKVHFEAADVLEKLQGEERYDVVIIDPPALAKSRAHLTKALGLYQALNRAAMEAVQPGGCLVSSCCSHFVDRESFLEVLKRAARSSQRDAQLIELRGPSPDHPELLEMPETSYFTCAILRIF